MASEEGLLFMTLLFIVEILTVILKGISKEASVLSVLMKVCIIPCHDSGHFNVVLVLQSCSDSLFILPGSSSDTKAASGYEYHVGNMKTEGDLDMQVEEENELNVKTEKDVGSEEDECIGIKDEEIYREEEVKEEHIDIKEEADINIKEENDVGIKEEVSLEGTV